METRKINEPKLIKNNPNIFKVLFIGDIVGRPGRNAVKELLPKIKEEEGIDFVIANGENLSAGKGMTYDKYKEMIEAGVDYFTSGNHIWQNREIIPYMKEKSVKVLRPANYPSDCPGDGSITLEANGNKITIVNLIGRVFIPGLYDDPFKTAKEITDAHKDSIIIVDFHAEATSEKIALAFYLDGQVSAVIGTHTHVQTADERILEKGTGFLSDAGMCGPYNSVLGVDKDIIIKGFLTSTPQSHKLAVGPTVFNACVIEVDKDSKKTENIYRLFKVINI